MSALPTVNSLSCTKCGAKPGATCIRQPSGEQAMQPHSARSQAFRTRMRKGARFVVLMRHGDQTHGLKKGEQYLAHAMWLQPDTVKLLCRLPDGQIVDCFQYTTAVRFIRWEV